MLIKIIGAIVAIAVIAVIVVGAAMWRGLIPVPGPLLALVAGAKEPEYSARFYPEDTLAYTWFTLAPGGGQFADMQDIWGRFNEYPAFEELVKELQEDFTDETGIDLAQEVMPWIGPEIGGGLIGIDLGESGIAMDDGLEFWEGVRAALTIGVRDTDAAAAFMDKWVRYLENTPGASFNSGSYRGFNTWVDEANLQAYALTGDWLVFATDKSTLEAVIDRIDGDGAGSLADTPNFTAAQAALPERRFNSTYISYRRALDSWEDFAIGGFGMMGAGAFADQTPEWAAISAAWVERGVVMEIVSPATAGFGLEVADLNDPARLLPDDTLGFMAAAFDPDVDRWRTALREYRLADVLPYPGLLDEINAGLAAMGPDGGPGLADDATLADALDLGFGLVKDFTGIDLEAGFFDHLGGEAILAVSEFDFVAIADDPANTPVAAVAMLSYREDGADGLRGTLETAAGLLQQYAGLTGRRDADVGADNAATVFPVDGTAYAPGYVLHDGYMTLGSNEDALAAIVARQNGNGAALSSDAEYLRALGHLTGRRQFLGYVDINGIIRQAEPDDLDIDGDQYRILAEGLGAVAMDSADDGAYSRATVALTLFPE